MKHRPNLLAEVNGLSTSTLIAALLILSAFLTSCMSPAYAPPMGPLPGEFSPDGGSQYGSNGVVSDALVLEVAWLAWPQTRQAMTNLIGYPMHFSTYADYYQAPGGQWLVIHYSGPQAVGFSMEYQ